MNSCNDWVTKMYQWGWEGVGEVGTGVKTVVGESNGGREVWTYDHKGGYMEYPIIPKK